MRNTRKIALALVIVMLLAMTLAIIPASAASQPEKLYLTPSANWKQSNARFAAYFFGNGEKWVSMTDADKDGVYEVTVPTDKVYPNVIFCRMNPSATANNWNNKWNQTSDLVIPTSGANHYTVKEGTWDKGGGTWSTFGSTCAHTNLGPAATCTTSQDCLDCKDPVVSALGHTFNSAHLCTRCNEQASFTVAGSGAHLGTEWDAGNKANDMTYADGVYTKVYTNVAAGSYLLKVARDHDWGTAYPSADKAYTVATAGSTVTVTLKGTTVDVKVEAPHTCEFVAGEVVPPTFDAEGYTVYSCTCGKTENRDVVPALVAVVTADGDKFASLEAALQGGSDIVLLADIKLDAPIVFNGSYTLNLNGFTLSYENTVMGEAMITNRGTLIINDTVGTGVINYNYVGANDASYGKGNYTISNAGNLTVNGGKITIANLRQHAKYPIDNNSTTGDAILVINGGHLYNYNTSAIRMFCNSTTNKNSVTINGGLVEGYSAIWMQNPGKNTVHGALSVTGGEIRTTAAAYVNGTSELKDVASKLYATIDGEGGAWAEDSLVSFTGGTFNENVYLLENAPANVTVGEGATFNGYIEYNVPSCAHEWADATCTAPKTCSLCGATDGEALGHTPGAEANCTTAQTCTVCGAELVAKLGHVDANLDIECDREGCTSKVAPKADSVLSSFTANCLGSKVSVSSKYYFIGTIVEVLDQKNGIFLADDGTGETFYFRLPKDADGVAHSSWEIKLTKGDKVQLYGAINKYTSSTAPNGQYWPAMQGPVVTLLEQHAHVANGEPVCTKDTYCACGTLVATATGHIDADANSLCDNCSWDMNLVEVNIAIGTDPKYNGVRVDDEAGKALSWTWSNGGFDAIISKGTSTVTLYTTAKDYMQLKKQNLLTIVNTEDVTVKYVVISVTNATYLTHLQTALKDQYEYTADETNFTVTIQLNSTEDFVLENKASSTIYVNGVTIVYAKKGAHIHEFKETITTPATCTEAGLKTFTCECGEGTYTEAIDALGHDYVEGVCSRCSVADPDYVPACKHKDTGLDAKCDLCGEYFLPESPFKLEMYQASKKETYYFTGSMSGYYFAASTDISKAVDLYAEEVDGGYNVYFMSGTTKNYLYIELSGTHINAKFGSTKGVWYVDPTYGSLTTEVDGTKYFLGTYSSYVTFGGTAYSRLNASTADVSQYVGRAVSLENHVCADFTSKVTDPTCTAQGYTTKTCTACGVSNNVDYVDALGHDIVADDAVDATCTETGLTAGEHCTRCDHKVAQETVDALGHDIVVDEAVEPTCTETGLTAGEHCTRCDHKVEQTVVDAKGHTFVDGKCECGEEDPNYVPPHEHNFVDGKCECGEEDPNYVPPHEHNFVEGKCECGEEDPNYVPETPVEPEEPQKELNFFEQIIKAITDFFAKIGDFFKNLFVKK